jgi:glutamine synthetase
MKLLEYIWLDIEGNICSKIHNVKSYKNFPPSAEFNSSLTLDPKKVFPHPLLENGLIVLCEVKFNERNCRKWCERETIRYDKHKTLFGIEQEYYMIFEDGQLSHSHYCGNRKINSLERKIAEEHLLACIKAEIEIRDMNAEFGSKQWKFHIGELSALDVSDHLIVARFLLMRIAEKYNVEISFHPKPFPELSGSGAHIKISNKKTRKEGTFEEIEMLCRKLEEKHLDYLEYCGKDNSMRVMNIFKFSLDDTNSAIRIPDRENNKYTYFEDRRPGANIDPYMITCEILEEFYGEMDFK